MRYQALSFVIASMSRIRPFLAANSCAVNPINIISSNIHDRLKFEKIACAVRLNNLVVRWCGEDNADTVPQHFQRVRYGRVPQKLYVGQEFFLEILAGDSRLYYWNREDQTAANGWIVFLDLNDIEVLRVQIDWKKGVSFYVAT